MLLSRVSESDNNKKTRNLIRQLSDVLGLMKSHMMPHPFLKCLWVDGTTLWLTKNSRASRAFPRGWGRPSRSRESKADALDLLPFSGENVIRVHHVPHLADDLDACPKDKESPEVVAWSSMAAVPDSWTSSSGGWTHTLPQPMLSTLCKRSRPNSLIADCCIARGVLTDRWRWLLLSSLISLHSFSGQREEKVSYCTGTFGQRSAFLLKNRTFTEANYSTYTHRVLYPYDT